MKVKVLRFAMLISAAQLTQAEEPVVIGDGLPSLELLEYLGELVENDGELLGPDDLDQSAPTESRTGADTWISRDNLYKEQDAGEGGS